MAGGSQQHQLGRTRCAAYDRSKHRPASYGAHISCCRKIRYLPAVAERSNPSLWFCIPATAAASVGKQKETGSTKLQAVRRGCMESRLVASNAMLQSGPMMLSASHCPHTSQVAMSSDGRHRKESVQSQAEHRSQTQAVRSCILITFDRTLCLQA